ncbi:MAG: exonuclease SbcCD subunit D, partial [Nitrospinales bacterium]
HDDLAVSGFDYWALGHIHNKQILRDYNPAIVYCGNSQARSFKEKGERGCCLVTLHKGAPPDIRFVATDAVRYHSADLDLSNASSIEDVLQIVQSTCSQISAQMEGRDVLLRLNLTGRTPIHSELRRPGTLEGLMEEIHEYFEGRSPAVWVDLELQTQGTYDIDSLKRGNDFVADILSLCNQAEEDAQLEQLRAVLKPLHEDWQGQLFLENPSREQLLELLREAKGLLLDRLMEDR